MSLRRLGARADRPLPAPPDRPQGAARGSDRRAARAAATRARSATSASPRSSVERDRGRPRGSSTVVIGAEPLQPRRPERRRRPRRTASATASASSPGSRSPPASSPSPAARSTRVGQAARRDPRAGGARLAAAALAGDAPDPRHLEGRAPRGEHRRGSPRSRRFDHGGIGKSAALTGSGILTVARLLSYLRPLPAQPQIAPPPPASLLSLPIHVPSLLPHPRAYSPESNISESRWERYESRRTL